MSKKAHPPPAVPSGGALSLLALGLAECALSLFQWSQLRTLRDGGSTVCAVSEHVNCETVWNSTFATRTHELLGIPVAGLGLIWGVVATALAALLLAWRSSGKPVRPAINGLRLTAAVGVLATVVFAGVSASAGALCLTCLGTYVLVLAFAGVAWRALPGPLAPLPGEWARTLAWTGGFAAAAFLALVLPGRATPLATAAESSFPPFSSEPASIEKYLRSLNAREQQGVAIALEQYLREAPIPAGSPARRLEGPVDAPVKVVEWTDNMCPHCKVLVENMGELRKHVPEGKLSVEARQYPLDGGCNPNISPDRLDGGLRCLASKATICLESAPDYWELRDKLFEAQRGLSVDTVMRIASSGTMNRQQLEACLNNPETARRLQDDIDYAQRHHLKGTPLLVVNGREIVSSVPFLYALAMAGGDGNSPAFRVLPPINKPPMAHSP